MVKPVNTNPTLYLPLRGVGSIPPTKAPADEGNGLDTLSGECWLFGQTSGADGDINIPASKSNSRAGNARPIRFSAIERGAAKCCKTWDF